MANSLSKFVDFVNEQAEFHERKALEHKGNRRGWRHQSTAETFRALKAEIDALQDAMIIRKPNGINPYALSPADVQGLPDELLKQLLNRPETDRLENDIVEIINEAGGTLLIDHILIGLFKRTKQIHDRTSVVGKIHRMGKKGMVFAVPRRKGVYTTVKPNETTIITSDGTEVDLEDLIGDIPLK